MKPVMLLIPKQYYSFLNDVNENFDFKGHIMTDILLSLVRLIIFVNKLREIEKYFL
jgi:hypothetical protein